MTGRPTVRSPAIESEICDRLSEGEPLAVICRDEHMPSRSTVYNWCDEDSDFSGRIARARDEGHDAIANECLDIADNATNDWMERNERDGTPGYALNGEHIQRSKLRVETRLKLLAKWNPKKYGDKIDVGLSAPGGGPIQVIDPSKLSDETIRELISASAKNK